MTTHDTTTRERVARAPTNEELLDQFAMWSREWQDQRIAEFFTPSVREGARKRYEDARAAVLARMDRSDAAIAAMPQHEVINYGINSDGIGTIEMRPVSLTAKGQRCCSICETPLDLPGRLWTRDCGGDCLACMAEVGDPDAVAAMGGWLPIETAIESAKSNDGWISRCLFGIQRSWGWETWVGQCDAGEWWLGRYGDGGCFDTDIPTHWQPLPALPPIPHPHRRPTSMRDPYETIATGPWRDETHRSAVEATAVDLTDKRPHRTDEEIVADHAKRYPVIMDYLARSERGETTATAPAEPQDAQVDVLRSTVQAGSGEGAGREPQRDLTYDLQWLSYEGMITGDAIASVYDTVLRFAAQAGPMPLVSDEPWVEGDEAYRKRLTEGLRITHVGTGWTLEALGERYDIPRARLVPRA